MHYVINGISYDKNVSVFIKICHYRSPPSETASALAALLQMYLDLRLLGSLRHHAFNRHSSLYWVIYVIALIVLHPTTGVSFYTKRCANFSGLIWYASSSTFLALRRRMKAFLPCHEAVVGIPCVPVLGEPVRPMRLSSH